MLKPALALVSMNSTPNSRALASPSSMDTCLWEARPPKVPCESHWSPWNARVRGSDLRVFYGGGGATDDALRRARTYRLSTRSVLFPTSTMMTSLPRSVRTSSTQRAVLRKEVRSASEKFKSGVTQRNHGSQLRPP